MEVDNRLIGRFDGNADGPMLVCLGGIHGNEPAGVIAIDLIMKMLEVEPITNPDFLFRGHMVGLRGNLKALRAKKRFIREDLNRALKADKVREILSSDPAALEAEDEEVYQLINAMQFEINRVNPSSVIVLDLHTTTAFGGIFVLTANHDESIRVGVSMNAPVITGFDDLLAGTTMGYFRPENFNGLPMTTVVFESGQHDEPLSVNRAIAATINCMQTIGCVRAEDVENRHNYLLTEYSSGLPKVSRILSRYHVERIEDFEMVPDFKNFDIVKNGDILAYEKGEPVRAPQDSLIIMPKYQEQGVDGFFLVEVVEGY